jgi:hypothetical protein
MVTYTHKAQMSFDTMQPHEQFQMKQIEKRPDRPIDELLHSGMVKKLDTGEEVFALRSADVVVMMDRVPEGIRILDIVPWQRMEHFHNALHRGQQLEAV